MSGFETTGIGFAVCEEVAKAGGRFESADLWKWRMLLVAVNIILCGKTIDENSFIYRIGIEGI